MRIIDTVAHEKELWRPGVLTRMRISALTGAAQVCIFEQWCDPGCGAPPHLHAVEEVLTVIAGQAEVLVGDERATLARRHSTWKRRSRRRSSKLPSMTCARQGGAGFLIRFRSRDRRPGPAYGFRGIRIEFKTPEA